LPASGRDSRRARASLRPLFAYLDLTLPYA
jgi:hypothetical protein